MSQDSLVEKAVVIEHKSKKIRTPEQLMVLSRAREKATEIRNENRVIKLKENDTRRLDKENRQADLDERFQTALKIKNERLKGKDSIGPNLIIMPDPNDEKTKEAVEVKTKETVSVPKEKEFTSIKADSRRYKTSIPIVESDDSDNENIIVRIPKKKLIKYHKQEEKKVIRINNTPVPIQKKNPLFYN